MALGTQPLQASADSVSHMTAALLPTLISLVVAGTGFQSNLTPSRAAISWPSTSAWPVLHGGSGDSPGPSALLCCKAAKGAARGHTRLPAAAMVAFAGAAESSTAGERSYMVTPGARRVIVASLPSISSNWRVVPGGEGGRQMRCEREVCSTSYRSYMQQL